ncbi:MAG: hypothetical protein GDA56_20665 [Hormoscilla sp. GM7CHS1pb]|nr:hypothetical protein [Hormoscilla sp. GM7CHS1pb]
MSRSKPFPVRYVAVDCCLGFASDRTCGNHASPTGIAIGYQQMTYTGVYYQSITGTNRANSAKLPHQLPNTQPLIYPESAALPISSL